MWPEKVKRGKTFYDDLEYPLLYPQLPLWTPTEVETSKYGNWTTKFVMLNRNPIELDSLSFIDFSKPTLLAMLQDALKNHGQIKFNMSLYVRCTDEHYPPTTIPIAPQSIPKYKTYESKTIALHNAADIEDCIDVLTQLIVMESNEQVSRCAIYEIVHLEVNINQLPVKKGACIELPPNVTLTRAVVNMKNYDNLCFKWAILSGVSSKNITNLSRPAIYKIDDINLDVIEYSGMRLDFSGLTYPVEVWQTKIFEERNPTIGVNVFGIELDGKDKHRIVGPLYRTKSIKPVHINLLYFEDEETCVCHYACIRTMSRLLRNQLQKKVQVCNMCLKFFPSEARAKKHKKCSRLWFL